MTADPAGASDGSALPAHDAATLRKRCATPRQFASVRRIVLDDGEERGVRAIACSSGGGLDLWALADRSLDIGPLWYRGVPLAWQHPTGFRSPALHDSHADDGTGIERSLSGFLVTCGLDNARQPRRGLPLHGSLPMTPARITLCRERWDGDDPCLEIEGEVVVAHLSRDAWRLQRRIEIPVGGSRFNIVDRIENIGLAPAELSLLYHVNLGYPMIDDASVLHLNGEPAMPSDATPVCHARGDGVGFTASLTQPELGLRIDLETDAATLSHFQIWRDTRLGRNVLALEPASCDRAGDGTSLSGPLLEPAEVGVVKLAIGLSSSISRTGGAHGSPTTDEAISASMRSSA